MIDLAIGLEAGAFAVALARARAGMRDRTPRAVAARRWFVVFFGGDERWPPWPAPRCTGWSPIATSPGAPPVVAGRRSGRSGCAGLSAWCLGGRARPAAVGAAVASGGSPVVAHAAYLAGLSVTNPPFAVAIGTYLPGALALGAGLVSRLRQPAERAAAAIALAGLGLHVRGGRGAAPEGRRSTRRLFDHNATLPRRSRRIADRLLLRSAARRCRGGRPAAT